MLSDLLYFAPFLPVPIALGVLGYVVVRALRRANRPLERIRDNLKVAADQLEIDLTQLQLEDTYGEVSQGWNRIIREVLDARRELESYQVKQEATATISRYQHDWVLDLLQKMPYGLVIIAEDLAVAFANATAERLLDQGDIGLVNRKLTDVFDEPADSLRLPGNAGMERTFDMEGPKTPLRVSLVRLDNEGGTGHTAVFLRDISLHKEMERARDQFLYHVTHELRTPLTNIHAYAETLSQGVLQDRDSLRECYNVIISETQRLSNLVEDILNVSQLEAGSARLQLDDVQTARLIRTVVEDMQASADEKNVELILSLPSKVPTIRGDKERLSVVLTNLIGNAVKYTPARGQVEVRCAEDGARLLIKVRDTGIGISPAEQARIFDKFFRSADERVAKLPGTGLGLAIARETARMHGGTLEVESTSGEGSTFTLSLPIGKTAALRSEEAR